MNEVAMVDHLIINGREFDFSRRTFIMGILNVTPDSFSDGGKYLAIDDAVARAMTMVEEGADIIDVGGESTRPKGLYGQGSQSVPLNEELQRVIPVIKRISDVTDTPISIDTTKSEVAREALRAGASIVNDISGLRFDPSIAESAAEFHAALILMHSRGTPETMQMNPQYDDVIGEVKAELQHSIAKAQSAGVQKIIIDPGIGFGKNLTHNLLLIKHLAALKELGFPILIGTSRKGFIGTLLNLPTDQRMEGTAASVSAAIMNGANIVRVHDVKEMKRIAVITDAIRTVE